MWIEFLMLSIIICFIVDISGIVLNIKKLIWKILNGKIPFRYYDLKPFDCQLCMNFWIGLIYSLYIGNEIILSLFIAVIMAYTSGFISNLLKSIYMYINKIISKIK